MSNTTHSLAAKITHLLIVLILSIALNLTAPLIARADPSVLYAAPTVLGSGDCSAWADTCTLQTALTTASSGQEIWVQEGVHLPGTTREDTFTLKSDVALYGGFDGTETSTDQRDWHTNLTILSGDIDADDTNTDGNNIAETTDDIVGDNAYHVVTGGGTDDTAVLDGFIVTAGQANGSWPQNNGGGMYNVSSSPTLTDVTFNGNAAEYGGGMYNDNSTPTITGVTFSDNTASNDGGGMYNTNSSPTLTDVSFSDNTASNDGGGMYNSSNSSSPTLTNVSFSGNSANRGGGGMFNNCSNPTLTDITFSGNSAVDYGGGMANWESNPTLTNVTFSDNTVSNNGGGMYISRSSPTLTNVTFSSNSAFSGGGVYNNYSSSPTLTNVTFSSNLASSGGGVYNNDNSSPMLTNVIIWNNSGSDIYNNSSTPSITYSDIQGCGGSVSWNSACGTDGGGNIDADPLFVNDLVGNLRLQRTSPAIDAGNNAAVPSRVVIDLDGKLRFVDIPSVPDTGSGTPPIVDMGAYEFQFKLIFLPLIVK